MKRLKHNFKKGMAFVLSLAMVAGLVPAMSGGANKVQAASGSGTEPSVSAYATKTQLMDGYICPECRWNCSKLWKDCIWLKIRWNNSTGMVHLRKG